MGDLGSQWPLMALIENRVLSHDNLDSVCVKGAFPFSFYGAAWDNGIFLKNYYEGNKKR